MFCYLQSVDDETLEETVEKVKSQLKIYGGQFKKIPLKAAIEQAMWLSYGKNVRVYKVHLGKGYELIHTESRR